MNPKCKHNKNRTLEENIGKCLCNPKGRESSFNHDTENRSHTGKD